jgi:hypothetical protein
MMWLSEREALQALDRFAKSSDPTERSRFSTLAAKVLVMVRAGWHGVEVEEDFLDAPVAEDFITVTLGGGPIPSFKSSFDVADFDKIESLVALAKSWNVTTSDRDDDIITVTIQ